ncbi:MAG: HAMP domain-containing histidine kinase [Micrococcales bacterium]|nr:HAMP domain-containing histidine kinase [Micrococcales bacterium]
MRLRWLLVAVVAVLAAGSTVLLTSAKDLPERSVNLVACNYVVRTLADSETLPPSELPRPQGASDYVVLAPDGRVLAATAEGQAYSLGDAYRHGDTVMDVERDDQVVARVAFRADVTEEEAAWTERFRLAVLVTMAGVGVVVVGFGWYVHRRLVRPFVQMKNFAVRVATGDLDTPLAMDRTNAFGAFTESFDLMRSELRLARDRERAADLSKKELVASLSHDLKTPVASIKAITECLTATEDDTRHRAQLDRIMAKTDQIDALVSNMLEATLDDAEQLVVAPVPVPSTRLVELLREADPKHRIGDVDVPECMIQADPVRLAQVVDNVVANSYKHARTPIEVHAWTDDDARALCVVVTDEGPGVDPAELPLLTHKYFRGAAAQGTPGAGLGLYLARLFAIQMNGTLTCANIGPEPDLDGSAPVPTVTGHGLAVTLTFALA